MVIENIQTLLDAEAARVRSHQMSREEILTKAEPRAINLKNKQHLETFIGPGLVRAGIAGAGLGPIVLTSPGR